MARRKLKVDLLIMEAADLLAGLDLFGAGTQIEVLEPEVPADLTALFAAPPAEPQENLEMPPAPAGDAVEVSLDEVFGGLVTAGATPAAVVAVEAAAELAPPEPVAVPDWREGELLHAQAARMPRAVILQKIGRKAVAVVPQDLISAAMLCNYSMLDKLGYAYQEQDPDLLSPFESAGTDGRLHFTMRSVMNVPFLEQSKLVAHLKGLGLNPVWGPSLENWTRKEFARRERENTPFDLPVIKDERPLYDRCELGLVLKCKQTINGFQEGNEYVVVETDTLDEEAGEDENKTEKGAVGLKLRGKDYGKASYWSEMDGDMAEYFELENDQAKVFDPENTFTARYPELFNAALKHIEGQKLPVFGHIQRDVAQLVHYKHVVFTDPPRQGKTSKLIQYAEAAGVKRAAFVTVSNGVDVFAQELKRMGISDFKIVRKLSDLNAPVRYLLLSYSWLKSAGRAKPPEQEDRLMPVNQCPHCQSTLMRPSRVQVKDPATKKPLLDSNGLPSLMFEYELAGGKKKLKWTDNFGYMCRNAACTHSSKAEDLKRVLNKKTGDKAKVAGPAWYGKNRKLKGYVDIALARHAVCVDQKVDDFGGSRRCKSCGYVHQTWMPPRYKRVRKAFSLIGVDEIHNIKNANSDQGRAILGMMHAKRRVGMTGTLMPNNPQDAFHPLGWTFGYNNYLFPFERGQVGVSQFNTRYTEKIVVESDTSSYSKAVPFIKSPIAWWGWKSSKTHFRAYSDPEVIASMDKAGLKIPRFRTIPVELVPDPKQGLLLVASIDQFDKLFKDYSAELKAKAKQNEKIYLLNSSTIIARMAMMRYAATIPGLLNDRLKEAGKPPVYEGLYGGCKMEYVKQVVAEKTAAKGKVVIFSDIRANQDLLEKELVFYNPIRFQVNWKAEKRAEMFRRFREDPDFLVWICGPRSVKESIDLSAADTVISTDLLWSPGIQMQAWSRVLTPRPVEREVECHIPLTKYSIDSHVYGTFYSKIAAAEQALYGRSLTKADKAFDVKYFVDQILAEKASIMQWLIESGESDMDYMPVLQTLQQLQSYGETAA